MSWAVTVNSKSPESANGALNVTATYTDAQNNITCTYTASINNDSASMTTFVNQAKACRTECEAARSTLDGYATDIQGQLNT